MIMKNKKWTLLLVFPVAIALTTISSCQRKTGCENEEAYKAQVDKNGNLSTKRGKSQLFSKKMEKNRRR